MRAKRTAAWSRWGVMCAVVTMAIAAVLSTPDVSSAISVTTISEDPGEGTPDEIDVPSDSIEGQDTGRADGSEISEEQAAPESADSDGGESPDGPDTSEVEAADENGAPQHDSDQIVDGGPLTSSFGITSARSAAGFRPGYIISNASFYNGSAMTATQVQSFLNSAVVNPTSRALRAYAQRTVDQAAAPGLCSSYSGSTSESAAQIIAKVGQACGISQQVLLVTLQKEQSLITNGSPTDLQLNRAMGYACPDTGPNRTANCDTQYYGFFNQVYHAAKQLKRYGTGSFTWIPIGVPTTRPYHTNPDCGVRTLTVENRATAALYYYTPYTPNSALLNGAPNGCSSYGNYNFYTIFKQWFGSPNTHFPDVPQSHKFFTEIEWMGSSGLSTGIAQPSGGLPIYKPGDRVSREAMAAFLYRLQGASFRAPAVSPFADLRPGDPFYREITWMHHVGYTTGIRNPNGGKPLFAPKDRVSREAMAAFLYRMEGVNYRGPQQSPFADVSPSDPFYNEIAWMRHSGTSTGISNPGGGAPNYAPKDRVSREAMAAFIYRVQ